MPFIHSSFLSIGASALVFGSFINAQAFYGNVSTFSNSLDSLAPQSPEIAAIFDAVTIFLLTPPLPTPAPGQPIPPALPTPTAAPSPNQPNPQEMPYASADPAVPAPTPTYGGDVHECSIYFQYVNVYYWPVASSNTDCLSLVSITPLPAIPSGHQIVSPSIYVVFPTISAGNASTRVGGIYTDFVTSFAPGELSTIEGPGGPTKAFDFADLPCPPPAIAAANSHFYNPQANPQRAYSPMIDLPRGILDMDPAFKNCVAAVYQGFDPPTALAPAGDVTPATKAHFGLPHKRAAAHPHLKPQLSNQGQWD